MDNESLRTRKIESNFLFSTSVPIQVINKGFGKYHNREFMIRVPKTFFNGTNYYKNRIPYEYLLHWKGIRKVNLREILNMRGKVPFLDKVL